MDVITGHAGFFEGANQLSGALLQSVTGLPQGVGIGVIGFRGHSRRTLPEPGTQPGAVGHHIELRICLNRQSGGCFIGKCYTINQYGGDHEAAQQQAA